jgi:hypothetical protein
MANKAVVTAMKDLTFVLLKMMRETHYYGGSGLTARPE